MFKDYLVPEDLKYGVGLGALYPEQWINDDYLYFTTVQGISGGGTCFYGFGVNGLHRIDLKTGTVSAVLSPRPTFYGYVFDFSPGGRRLIYEVDRSITMLDMRTGEKSHLDHGEGIAGDFTWSPDGKKLAYATCQTTEDYYWIKKSTVQIYELETGKIRTILQVGENHHLYVNAWEEDELLRIVDRDAISGKEIELLFDESSDQLMTPIP